jgi:hypothetical protein
MPVKMYSPGLPVQTFTPRSATRVSIHQYLGARGEGQEAPRDAKVLDGQERLKQRAKRGRAGVKKPPKGGFGVM